MIAPKRAANPKPSNFDYNRWKLSLDPRIHDVIRKFGPYILILFFFLGFFYSIYLAVDLTSDVRVNQVYAYIFTITYIYLFFKSPRYFPVVAAFVTLAGELSNPTITPQSSTLPLDQAPPQSLGAHTDNSEPLPHNPTAYSSKDDISAAATPAAVPVDNSGWPNLTKISVAHRPRAKSHKEDDDAWQGYHWEGGHSIRTGDVSLVRLANRFVSEFRRNAIPGDLHWDSAVPRSQSGFGFAVIQPIHREIRLSTRITYHRQAHGIDVVVIQDLIFYKTLWSKLARGLVVAGILAAGLALFYGSFLTFRTAPFLMIMSLFAVGFIFTCIALLGLHKLFGNPRAAMAAQPGIVNVRSAIMHLVSVE